MCKTRRQKADPADVRDLAQRIYRAVLDGGNTPEFYAAQFGLHFRARDRRDACHSAIHWIRCHEFAQQEVTACAR